MEEIYKLGQGKGLKGGIYRTALEIHGQHAETIRKRWPRTWRNSSGYALNYLIPWSDSQPPMAADPHQPTVK